MAKPSQVKARRKIINPLFHLQTKKEDDNQLTQGMMKVVRKTGQLNLSGRNLATVPESLFSIYDYDPAKNVSDYDMSKTHDDKWWDFKPLSYLDLSSNSLIDLPKNIQIFEDLSCLNLQDNNLTTLPPEIGALTKLTKLNLSHNKINILPLDFYKLIELQTLNISHNCLEVIETEFVDLVMLQTLDLSYNLLTTLPIGIGYLVRLNDFNLSHNQLNELPQDIANIRALLKLDVTYNNLKSLPKLGELRKLQALYAQHNDIVDIPDFEGCEHLQEIHLGNNFIREVTSDFCENMPLLKILDLKDNKIEEMPDEIAMLQHIIRLDLTNNDLNNLPNTLGLLSHLQNLQIEGNKFKHIRQDMIKGGTCRLLKHLRDKLDAEDISKMHLVHEKPFSCEPKTFPDKYMMRNSRALNLSQKELNCIPDNVFEDALSAEVTVIDLSKNKLTEVPNGLNMVAAICTELNLSNNKLKTFPQYASDFCKLQYLDLGKNLLADLPVSLGSLTNLRELVISNNSFTNIPSCIYDLEYLEILLASDNQIVQINVDGLKRLTRLATLDLTNNNIDHVPLELGNMKQIRSLEIRGNSFRLPRHAVLEQGTESILSYLRDRIPTN